MIKNIASIRIATVDNLNCRKEVLMIPASGKYNREITYEAPGRLATKTIEFKVTEVLPEMYGDVILDVRFDDGWQSTIGTADLPARLEIKESDVIRVSCKWEHPFGF